MIRMGGWLPPANERLSGANRAVSTLGSSNSYGRRYTTKDLLNIVTKEEDDDGKKSSAPAEPSSSPGARARSHAST